MKKYLLLITCFSVITVSVSSDQAKVSKNDFVREKPFADSKVVVSLKTGQTVDIQKRQGSWYLVAIGKKTGWAPMLSVRRTMPSKTASTGSLSTASTGRSSSTGVVSTTGIRGLNEENLKTAEFDSNAVVTVEKNRVSPTESVTFAQAGGVEPHDIPALSSGGKK